MMNLSFFLVDKDDIRKHLQSPFSVDGYTAATNGQVAIFTTDDCEQEANDDDKATKSALSCLLKTATDINADKRKRKIEIIEFKTMECKTCGGSGRVSECAECDGDGELELESDFNVYTVTCKNCGGCGVLDGDEAKCDTCNGTGYSGDYVKINNGRWFQRRYIEKIIEMGGRFLHQEPGISEAYFSMDSGFIVLMPVNFE